MDQEMDLNERYDKDVQKMASHFDFDLDLVQECYEHCCVPTIIDDDTYKVALDDLILIKGYQKALMRAQQKYDQLSDLIKSLDPLFWNQYAARNFATLGPFSANRKYFTAGDIKKHSRKRS